MTDGNGTERLEGIFRSGSVTVVGVVVGFSLTYLTAWATNPVPWHLHDLIGMTPLAVGILFQLVALAALLHPNSLERRRYDRAIRLFLIGLSCVAVGVVITIGVEALLVAKRD
jgi:hypothetical protein